MKNIILVILTSTSTLVFAQDLKSQRIQWILDAFNSNPEHLVEPLTVDQVELGEYEGRVMVNKKAKFSYYVHIEEKLNPNSKLVLIPMATSRFAPNYYQTDEWWNKHKNEKPMPKQDPAEVLAWLNEMKLTTNPDVLVVIDPTQNQLQRIPLKEYLLSIYLENFVENGKIVLYRGAEKPGEHNSWKKGEMPSGVRYWTPTANYAWRYARKNKEFLDLLVEKETPLFRFEIPTADFKEMVLRRWPHLTLGTELTKNAHSVFDSKKYFGDHLFSSQPYLGIGSLGVEFEVRSNRAGAQQMAQYFVRAATVDDLVNDRKRVLYKAKERFLKQMGLLDSDQVIQKINNRIESLEIEKKVLTSIIKKDVNPDLENQLNQISQRGSELTLIDGVHFQSWAQSKSNSVRICLDVIHAK